MAWRDEYLPSIHGRDDHHLDDVFCITGMPITGSLVRSEAVKDLVQLLVDTLGVSRDQALAELGRIRG